MGECRLESSAEQPGPAEGREERTGQLQASGSPGIAAQTARAPPGEESSHTKAWGPLGNRRDSALCPDPPSPECGDVRGSAGSSASGGLSLRQTQQSGPAVGESGAASAHPGSPQPLPQPPNPALGGSQHWGPPQCKHRTWKWLLDALLGPGHTPSFGPGILEGRTHECVRCPVGTGSQSQETCTTLPPVLPAWHQERPGELSQADGAPQ